VIEKHFTLSRAMEGPDHPFAIEPDELRSLVAAIRQVEAALGDGVKAPHPCEEEILKIGRRNVVTARDLRRGEVVKEDDVAILRSPLGVAPKHLDAVVGRVLRRDLSKGTPLQWEDLV
jgi:sialic acid synthase SpsE